MRTKTKNKALEYAEGVISGEIHAPKYVKIQCKQFKRICDGKDEKYFLNEKRLDKIIKPSQYFSLVVSIFSTAQVRPDMVKFF